MLHASNINRYSANVINTGHIVINCFEYPTIYPFSALLYFIHFFTVNTWHLNCSYWYYIYIKCPCCFLRHIFSMLLLIPVKGHIYFVFLLNNSIFTPMYYTRRWHGSFRIFAPLIIKSFSLSQIPLRKKHCRQAHSKNR